MPPDEAREAVEHAAALQVPWIKFIRDELPVGSALMEAELVETIVKATHNAGRVSIAHIVGCGSLLRHAQLWRSRSRLARRSAPPRWRRS